MIIKLEKVLEGTSVTEELLAEAKASIGKKLLDLNTPCSITPLYSKKVKDSRNKISFYITVSINEKYQLKQNPKNKIICTNMGKIEAKIGNVTLGQDNDTGEFIVKDEPNESKQEEVVKDEC